jgi:streptomycin 6-kinase
MSEIADSQPPIAKRPRTLNPTALINRAAVRDKLLELAKELRPFHVYDRVSEDILIHANEHLRLWLVIQVKGLPSKGKTI